MKNLKVITTAPIFPGFTGTHFEPNPEFETHFINEERKGKGLPANLQDNDLIFDDGQYQRRVAFTICEVLNRKIHDFIDPGIYLNYKGVQEDESIKVETSINLPAQFNLISKILNYWGAFREYVSTAENLSNESRAAIMEATQQPREDIADKIRGYFKKNYT